MGIMHAKSIEHQQHINHQVGDLVRFVKPGAAATITGIKPDCAPAALGNSGQQLEWPTAARCFGLGQEDHRNPTRGFVQQRFSVQMHRTVVDASNHVSKVIWVGPGFYLWGCHKPIMAGR